MAVYDKRLTGRNRLSYLGVNAISPPNFKKYNRAPTTSDNKGFIEGDEWQDDSVDPAVVYKLTSLKEGIAIWQGTTLPSGGTNGQILVGSTGLPAVWTDLTSTGGTITVTGGAGTLNIESGGSVPIQFDGDTGSAVPALGILDIVGGVGVTTSAAGNVMTISSSAGGLAWTEVTGTTQAMAVDNGYLANNAAPVVFTLPATAAQFSIIEVVGKGAGGWKIEQNAGQTIIWETTASTTTGVGGYLESTDDYDKVAVMCTVTDTDFTVVASKGNITIV